MSSWILEQVLEKKKKGWITKLSQMVYKIKFKSYTGHLKQLKGSDWYSSMYEYIICFTNITMTLSEDF